MLPALMIAALHARVPGSKTKLLRTLALACCALTIGAGVPRAAQVTGTIESIATRVQTIQIVDAVTQQQLVLTLSKDTVFVNANSLRDFALNDTVVVEVEPGRPVTRITRAVVTLGPEQMVSTEQLSSLLSQPGTFTLVDARPRVVFDEGHIPTAISIFVEELPSNWNRLPSDLNRPLVFYCSGSA